MSDGVTTVDVVDVGVRVIGKLVGVSNVGVGISVVIVVDVTDGLEEGVGNSVGTSVGISETLLE